MEERIQALEKANTAKDKQILALEKDLDKYNEDAPALEEQIKTLQIELDKKDEQIVALQKDCDNLKTELEDADGIIAELKERAANGDKDAPIVATVSGKKYRIVGGFRDKDREYKPEDIKADQKLLKSLIEKRSGLIKEVV